ncbi:DEAD-box ATP-dependent RNA helicase FANCM isoform X1 [Ziziphus jujuba]|uniref:DEAD-box ATP-dependent RNA helicase FANCM isoform X1 n=4 Tax=Ziziphus jujuba TaxID=326968 RepID=A0A6P6G8C4_ZIZJJ|nr:DEAD-box ATP-dependent RNA helicase FANCM isoform X1 [Ziziphus jujuba]
MDSAIGAKIVVEDDDDEFDWEAAVREIDVACQTGKPSSSSCNFEKHESEKKKKKNGSNSRQSTLHEFVAKEVPRPQQERSWDTGERRDERVCDVEIDVEAAKTWIYPVNVPLRDYQLAITKKALFSNTLVALPTGLGKTLIAAVVMYNYFRWFPDGKIVFTAPSRPLVMQQIEACHGIVGIPQDWTIDLTGQVNPTKRACFWKSKRVFFVTPQVLEKDIQSGTCLVNYLVLLVIDEAHRAMGNYAYCVAIRKLMDVPVQLRILALTATPGAKQQTIQQIIDNLHISTLEYRNESDHDVSPYVHNRKIELIQVALGKDAVEINKMILEVIRPYVARLSAVGVLQHRDYETLSPCELLNSRDKFRQAPPVDLPPVKYGDVEGYFGVLITLYHIRKLLSSHGIRPACEMLEEKLRQGPFARYMSRNEDLLKVKLLMQQNLSHGAPSPKLSKMLEVLLDHFKLKDPQNSRVIIFSNFRGSVRDIMDALSNIGNIVRATQFIGQSSGKTLKGQSQKVQQAVLEKFRAGGYNVIVATSIGEEGLDIMEVDLVICFDANVSPLRMIQRMGRTGRKHDGRVVVLACEGSELKGYMRKQANSKAVRKHMRNGGMNSFNFHPSPRMIPHIYKPEVQFVELSIEQFVRRGKKVKDDATVQSPAFRDKLTVAETNLIAKYFHPPGDITWKPSLIAFPHFQTFPSRVHKVMHSFKTRLLIDTMQYLQELSFAGNSKVSPFKHEEVCLEKSLETSVEQQNKKDMPLSDHSSEKNCQAKDLGPEISHTKNLETKEKHGACEIPCQRAHGHSYLFGSDFVSVDDDGNVIIVTVPLLPFGKVSHPSKTRTSNTLLVTSSHQDPRHLRASVEEHKDLTIQAEAGALGDLMTSPTRYMKNGTPISILCHSDAWQENTFEEAEHIPQTPISKRIVSDGDGNCTTPGSVKMKASTLLPDDYSNDFGDTEFSPRLTNMIKTGVVPESPINNCGQSNGERRENNLGPDAVSPTQAHSEMLLKTSSPGKNELVYTDSNTSGRISVHPINNEIQTPELNKNKVANITGCFSSSPILEEVKSPLANVTNNSCSKDWRLSSGDKTESVKPVRKFKRLRKIGDHKTTKNLDSVKTAASDPSEEISRSFPSPHAIHRKHQRGRRKQDNDAIRPFIEEEAEVSTDASVSDDEEDDQDNDSNNSFIDDRINPTSAGTQSETSRVDMMAIYRRSLLTQSPIPRLPSCSSTFSPDSVAPTTRTSDSGSISGKGVCFLQTPQADSTHQSISRHSKSIKINHDIIKNDIEVVPSTACIETESRKRKLSFCLSSSVPVINLEQKFQLQFEDEGRQLQQSEANSDILYDDKFYEDIDLDAIEAQATLLLKHKSESLQEQKIIPQPQNPGLISSPSFDLGI